jgi:hypothetical protein
MRPQYHRRITAQALEKLVSPAVLENIISANLGQDALRYQVAHDHFHYDNNSFTIADAYIEQQRRAVMDSLERAQVLPAWQAFGRLTHAAQDFYAHSNYTTLWREHNPGAASDQIIPLFGEALNDSRLHSGRLYLPLEILSFIPILQPLILPLLPRDSHAWMNKDDPSRPGFDLAYTAAVKRTELEFRNIIQSLTLSQAELFTGKLGDDKLVNRELGIGNRQITN